MKFIIFAEKGRQDANWYSALINDLNVKYKPYEFYFEYTENYADFFIFVSNPKDTTDLQNLVFESLAPVIKIGSDLWIQGYKLGQQHSDENHATRNGWG
jgi:hypothetical protein